MVSDLLFPTRPAYPQAWNHLTGPINDLEGLWSLDTLQVLQLGANKLEGMLSGTETKGYGARLTPNFIVRHTP